MFSATDPSYQNRISKHAKFLIFIPSKRQVSHLYLTSKTVALYIFKSILLLENRTSGYQTES
jgi:hypothetical protein